MENQDHLDTMNAEQSKTPDVVAITFNYNSDFTYESVVSFAQQFPTYQTRGDGKEQKHAVVFQLVSYEIATVAVKMWQLIEDWDASVLRINKELTSKDSLIECRDNLLQDQVTSTTNLTTEEDATTVETKEEPNWAVDPPGVIVGQVGATQMGSIQADTTQTDAIQTDAIHTNSNQVITTDTIQPSAQSNMQPETQVDAAPQVTPEIIESPAPTETVDNPLSVSDAVDSSVEVTQDTATQNIGMPNMATKNIDFQNMPDLNMASEDIASQNLSVQNLGVQNTALQNIDPQSEAAESEVEVQNALISDAEIPDAIIPNANIIDAQIPNASDLNSPMQAIGEQSVPTIRPESVPPMPVKELQEASFENPVAMQEGQSIDLTGPSAFTPAVKPITSLATEVSTQNSTPTNSPINARNASTIENTLEPSSVREDLPLAEPILAFPEAAPFEEASVNQLDQLNVNTIEDPSLAMESVADTPVLFQAQQIAGSMQSINQVENSLENSLRSLEQAASMQAPGEQAPGAQIPTAPTPIAPVAQSNNLSPNMDMHNMQSAIGANGQSQINMNIAGNPQIPTQVTEATVVTGASGQIVHENLPDNLTPNPEQIVNVFMEQPEQTQATIQPIQPVQATPQLITEGISELNTQIQIPASQIPVTQTPMVQAQVAQAQVAQAQVAQKPVGQIQAGQMPVAQKPIAQMPVVETASTQTQVAQTVATQAPFVASETAQVAIQQPLEEQINALHESTPQSVDQPLQDTANAFDAIDPDAFAKPITPQTQATVQAVQTDVNNQGLQQTAVSTMLPNSDLAAHAQNAGQSLNNMLDQSMGNNQTNQDQTQDQASGIVIGRYPTKVDVAGTQEDFNLSEITIGRFPGSGKDTINEMHQTFSEFSEEADINATHREIDIGIGELPASMQSAATTQNEAEYITQHTSEEGLEEDLEEDLGLKTVIDERDAKPIWRKLLGGKN